MNRSSHVIFKSAQRVPNFFIQRGVFTIDTGSKEMVADVSDVVAPRGQVFGPLYDDAADVGIALRNERERTVATFALSNEKRDDEGDVQMWVFEPTSESIQVHPSLKGWTVILFND